MEMVEIIKKTLKNKKNSPKTKLLNKTKSTNFEINDEKNISTVDLIQITKKN